MKTKFNVFGMCFDWRVLVGLVAIGIVIAILAPQLTLSASLLLLLATCPLSMFLMMVMMNRSRQRLASAIHQLEHLEDSHDRQLAVSQAGHEAALSRTEPLHLDADG